MVRRAGMRRWVRWGGVAVVAGLPLLWAASLFGATCVAANECGPTCGIGAGAFIWEAKWSEAGDHLWHWKTNAYPKNQPLTIILLPRLHSPAGGTFFALPLWIPWLLAAGFTAWRFRADGVKPPHACPSCGYDKTGLTPGAACPECGTVAPSK